MGELNQHDPQGGQDRPMDGKYLTFTLDDEEFGIGILTIKEIIGMMPITPIPRTPGWMLGVINLRGKVIPVVDLRQKFSMDSRTYDDRTCIIVVEVRFGEQLLAIGLVVDAVNEVSNIKADEVAETPDFGSSLDTHYILGLAKADNRVRILLDIDRVLCSEERTLLSRVA